MINSDSRLTKHLVEAGFFRTEPLVILDVGARGGFESFWTQFAPLTDPVEGVVPHMYELQKFFYETLCDTLEQSTCSK